MKASKIVTLALLGSTGLLASCGEEEKVDTATFESVSQCAASGKYSSGDCQTAFDQAKATGEKDAPKFNRKEDCEAQFGDGNCETKTTTNPDGSISSSIMPLMTGFLVGNMVSNMMNSQRSPVYPQPLYRDKERRYVSSGGAVVTRSLGNSVNVSPRSFSSPSSSFSSSSKGGSSFTSTSGRGGFGGGFSSSS